MPIMNGYEACKKIIDHYNLLWQTHRNNSKQEDLDEIYQQKNWIQDLKMSYLTYLKIIQEQSKHQSEIEFTEVKQKLLTILFNLY